MTDAEKRVREAFDALEVPPGLNERTLSFIEGKRESGTDLPTSQTQANRAKVAAPKRSRRAKAAIATIAAAACLALAFVGVGLLDRNPAEESASSHQLEQLSQQLAESAAENWPTAHVAIDMNPSIELAVKADDTVLEAFGLNVDGALVLEELDEKNVALKGMPLDQAIRTLVESDGFASRMTADSLVALSVTCEDEQQRQRLMSMGNECLAALPCAGTCQAVDPAERAAAVEAGMGVQRYRAAQELMELDPGLTLEDCSAMSMRELRDRIELEKAR